MKGDDKLDDSQAVIADASPKPSHRTGPRLPKAPNTGSISAAAQQGSIGKTVLLVDSDRQSRESRTQALRAQGAQVDCVASVAAARTRLATETYKLILVDLGRNIDGAETLVQEIRARNSRQLVRFLVGSPLFIATSLNGHRTQQGPVPLPTMPSEKVRNPVSKTFDFGQKVREAEAEETP